MGERFNIREIAFDRWGAVQMVQNLEGMEFTVVPFGQGFKDMSPPTKELMKLTLEQKLAHGGHPVLRWMIHHGKEWNGFKVVEGRSNRKYRDELLVAEAAREHGYTDIYRQTLIPMTEMQKLMGKSAFEEILGDLIYKPPGKPILVPNTDKRPAMNVTNAENEFDKIMEDERYG